MQRPSWAEVHHEIKLLKDSCITEEGRTAIIADYVCRLLTNEIIAAPQSSLREAALDSIAEELLQVLYEKMFFRGPLPEEGWAKDKIKDALRAALREGGE